MVGVSFQVMASLKAASGSAYPTVEATNTSSAASAASASVSLPTGIVSGNLLIALCVLFDDRTHTWPAGWTELYDADTGSQSSSAAYRVADGSEGASITVNFGGGSSASAHITMRISNYQGTPEVGTAVGGISTSPNPPSITPSWGSDDILVLAMVGARTTSVVSAAPSSYTDLLTVAAGGSGPSAAIARREVTGTTEDPGTATLPSSVEWTTNTLAIRGA